MKVMKLHVILFFLLIHSAIGQDERFYRGVFTGALNKQKKTAFIYKVEVAGPKYMLDLDRDGVKDSLQLIKRDGVDFIRINDYQGRAVFEQQLDTKGKQSKVFKIHLKTISPTVDVLIVHYFEGYNGAVEFEASARLYFATIKDRDLSKITFSPGPHFWHEYELSADKFNYYWNRRYQVNTLDYNGDGVNEISISFNKIQRIFFYSVDGKFLQL